LWFPSSVAKKLRQIWGTRLWRKKSDEGISLVTFGGFSVLQVVGIVHGLFQHDLSLILGMAASLLTCGSVTALTIVYRVRRVRVAN
jgi:MtN3 and saliva related transmembrane protein